MDTKTRSSRSTLEGLPAAAQRERERRRLAPDATFITASTLFAGLVVANEIGTDGDVLERLALGVVVVGAAAGGVLAFRSSGRRLRGVLALAVGSLTLAAAIGSRAYMIAKAGLSPIDAIALPASVAGVLLIGQGATLLLRPVRRWRRLVAIPIGLLVLYYVVAPVTLALIYTSTPATSVGSRTPADLGLAYRDVRFRTSDGVSLSGWYLPSRNGTAVALLHGSGSTRSATLEHAAFLNREGFGVLAFDSRGFGRSGGTGMSLGWFGDLDIDGAMSFLSDRPGVDPAKIGVVGLSMGGEEAIAAAGTDDRIRAVVAEGAGAVRTVADAKSIDGFTRYLGIPHYWLRDLVMDMFTDAPRPIALEDAMTAIAPRPVLLISSAPRELEYTEQYRAAAPASTQLWALYDAPHIGGLTTHPSEYRQRVTAFLADALNVGGI